MHRLEVAFAVGIKRPGKVKAGALLLGAAPQKPEQHGHGEGERDKKGFVQADGMGHPAWMLFGETQSSSSSTRLLLSMRMGPCTIPHYEFRHQ